MQRTGPTVARRSLARILRERRKALNVKREDVARHAGVTPPTINRIEAASVRAEVGTVALMLDLYDFSDEERAELLDMARAAKKRGWWQRYSLKVPKWFSVYIGLEHEAAAVLCYQVEVVPGLVQTEDYVRALLRGESHAISEEEEDRCVTVRRTRQKRLFGDDPPKVWAVISEAALYRQVGGREVLREQLEQLIRLARQDRVTVQVLPAAAGAHAAIETPFTLLTFADPQDRDVVYVEYRLGAVYLEEPDESETYNAVFEQLTRKALDQEGSIALIRTAIKALG
ncbi:helix-turn-helix domain-containing protein [Allosalinactinospora lopnorensis]|uniref:helix-turn-helix domain-containing protein n=1 Tax=Allosalinactinospora lopnorensis TaxID=1352348 RepID=UPI000623D7BA|nr:helix-turn-helix transcriptional regulator [Allosalinactinospora lopnorensis]